MQQWTRRKIFCWSASSVSVSYTHLDVYKRQSPDDADEEDGIVIMETIFEGNEPVFTFVEDQALAQAVLDEYAARADEDEDDDDEIN